MGINSEVKAVFLDRDGVLNKSLIVNGLPFPPNNINEIIIPFGVKEGLANLKKMGFITIVVTNQPDVARNKTTKIKVNNINNFLKERLDLDHILCCFHDDADNCDCRKPKHGMIDIAKKSWNINLKESFLVGDRWKDIECGNNAGLTTFLIDHGYNEKFIEPNFICKNFNQVVKIIKSLKQ